MNGQEIDDAFRSRVDDKAEPYGWSDEDLVVYRNEAVREYRRRIPLFDDSTPEICEIAVTASEARCSVDARVIEVRRAKLGLATDPLLPYERSELDYYRSGWQTETGTPEGYLETGDGDSIMIRLVPIPVVADTLYLEVGRLPLEELELDAEPEVPLHDHFVLLDWMAHLAYQKQDVDTRDDKKSATWGAMFTSKVGPRPTSRGDGMRREMARGPRRVRAHR